MERPTPAPRRPSPGDHHPPEFRHAPLGFGSWAGRAPTPRKAAPRRVLARLTSPDTLAWAGYGAVVFCAVAVALVRCTGG